jgi:hypothetical protein
LLAKDVNPDAGYLHNCGALMSIASKLAPSGPRLIKRGKQLATVGGHQRVIVAEQFEHL